MFSFGKTESRNNKMEVIRNTFIYDFSILKRGSGTWKNRGCVGQRKDAGLNWNHISNIPTAKYLRVCWDF